MGALLWASNRRLFSVSRNLWNWVSSPFWKNLLEFRRERAAQNRLSESSYELLHGVSSGLLESYCKEREVKFEDFVVVEPSSEDLYEYPVLFFTGG